MNKTARCKSRQESLHNKTLQKAKTQSLHEAIIWAHITIQRYKDNLYEAIIVYFPHVHINSLVKLPLQQQQASLDIELQQRQQSSDNHVQSLLFRLQIYPNFVIKLHK